MPTISQLVRNGRQRKVRKATAPALQKVPATPRRLCSCLHINTQEAQLGASKGRACAFDEWNGSDQLHSWRGSQASRALGCSHSWWSC